MGLKNVLHRQKVPPYTGTRTDKKHCDEYLSRKLSGYNAPKKGLNGGKKGGVTAVPLNKYESPGVGPDQAIEVIQTSREFPP
jgi:hypothetical protein